MKLIESIKNILNKDEKEEIKKEEEIQMQEQSEDSPQSNKSGWVYIISNRGSFGENIYKIGATKSKDPQKRVDDLGDASVPFKFDVHAFIYSEDVFNLEAQIHRFLKDKEVNKINHRKEFYKVSLEEIKEIVSKLGYKCKWTDDAPAIEYERSKNINKNEI